MQAYSLVEPGHWMKTLAGAFEFTEGWVLGPEETHVLGTEERLLEQPDRWSNRAPEQQTFMRDKLHAALVSAVGPAPEDETVVIFLQRSRPWPPEEILRLQEYAVMFSLALAYVQQRDIASRATRQALEENRLLGVGHMAVRLGKEMKEVLEALPAGSEVQKLEELANQLVIYARRAPGAVERIHLHKLLDEVLRIVQSRVEEQGCLISVETPLPVTVLGRSVDIRKLLVDLVLLALQPDGFVELKLTFDASHATLQVTSGQPLDPSSSDWAVCQDIARQNSGQLTVQEGSCLLRFPLAADAESATEALDTSKMETATPRSPYLCVTRGPLASVVFPIDFSEVRLGRSEECEISLAYNGVSRVHASLHLEAGGKVRLRDLKSTNGTYVNGVRIEEQVLKEGDTVALGTELEMVFGFR